MYGERCPLGEWQMPRSLAQRRISRISSLARGLMLPHSVNKAALCNGEEAFTEMSMGTACSKICSSGGTRSVILGSAPRKPERRNLKPPVETRRSAQRRNAHFCSIRPSAAAFGRDPASLGDTRSGRTLMTTSTSGTATPLARPRERSLLAKPRTSTSGRLLANITRMASARRSTPRWEAGVGMIWVISSCTSSSRLCPWKVGAKMGTAGVCAFSSTWASFLGAGRRVSLRTSRTSAFSKCGLGFRGLSDGRAMERCKLCTM
mmetsp:Transcript_70878/g.169139  ORF Transcript_70878/g.169139 Transcript_70878/m.169139 type:complete len:262 (-) Transcript_70878:297-1082(-)